MIIPIREDRRYRSWHLREVPESNAVIIFCMDVSGSMGEQQKEIVRIASFWIDTWLRSQYKSLDNVYIVHEAVAREVDQHTFYHLRESGGTRISTAYERRIRSSTRASPPTAGTCTCSTSRTGRTATAGTPTCAWSCSAASSSPS